MVSMLVVLFLVNFVGRSFTPILPLYLQDLGVLADRLALHTGLLISAYAVAAAVSAAAFGRATRSRPPRGLLVASLFGGTLAVFPMSLVSGFAQLLALAVVQITEVSAVDPDNERDRVMVWKSSNLTLRLIVRPCRLAWRKRAPTLSTSPMSVCSRAAKSDISELNVVSWDTDLDRPWVSTRLVSLPRERFHSLSPYLPNFSSSACLGTDLRSAMVCIPIVFN